jgi:hypothetical protein
MWSSCQTFQLPYLVSIIRCECGESCDYVLFMLGVDHLGNNGQSEVVSCHSSYWSIWSFCGTNVHWFFSPLLSGGLFSLKDSSSSLECKSCLMKFTVAFTLLKISVLTVVT